MEDTVIIHRYSLLVDLAKKKHMQGGLVLEGQIRGRGTVAV